MAEKFEYLIVDNLQNIDTGNSGLCTSTVQSHLQQHEDSRSHMTHGIILTHPPNVQIDFETSGLQDEDWNIMDVRNMVEKYDRKKMRTSPLVGVLDSGVVEPSDRRELVRVAVAGMVEFNGGNLYPPCQLKTQLARDIVTAFPKLRSASGGYEHFYDPKMNRGFIEFRLKTLRLKLNPSEKKRVTGTPSKEKKASKAPVIIEVNESLLDDREFESKVKQLFMADPTEENKVEILKLTAETQANRQKLIKSAGDTMPLAIALNVYPRFKDFKGEVIRKEFSIDYASNDTFVEVFTTYYTPRILQYCQSTKPHFVQSIQDITDNNLKALILLPELLPSPNYTKRRENKPTEPKMPAKFKPPKTVPNENLLQFVNIHDEALLNEIFSNRKSPFLICCMINNERKGNFFIKSEGHMIPVGDNAIVAFDVLLKLHYCFNVPFNTDLVNFYDFITGCIMHLNEPKGCCVALDSTLSNITVAEPSNRSTSLQ